MTHTVLACFFLLIVIVGCAQSRGRWENADLREEKWAQDESDCRFQASEKAMQEFRAFDDEWTESYDPAHSVETLWQWQRVERREIELFEICMTEKGYLQVYPDQKSIGPLDYKKDQQVD